MTDFSHLDALNLGLSHERIRLANAKNKQERDLRSVWVAQIEKEIAAEYKFLGIEIVTLDEVLSDEELLASLTE